MFLKRLGPDPHANGAKTIALCNCPDIFELESGDFAIIGIDITSAAAPVKIDYFRVAGLIDSH